MSKLWQKKCCVHWEKRILGSLTAIKLNYSDFNSLTDFYIHVIPFPDPAGDSDKVKQLEETIRGLTKDLHNMQTTIHGMNQRLYVTVVFNPSHNVVFLVKCMHVHPFSTYFHTAITKNTSGCAVYCILAYYFVYFSRSVYGGMVCLFINILYIQRLVMRLGRYK